MLNYKKLNVVIAFVVTFLSVCYANAQTSNSLSQGFRGIPWETKNSAFKNDSFERTSEYSLHVSRFVKGSLYELVKTDYNTGKYAFNLNESLEFDEKDVFVYTKKDDNLSLGDKIKLKIIYYVVHDNKFIGIAMLVDQDRSASQYKWSDDLKEMFQNNKFRAPFSYSAWSNNDLRFTKIDRNTKLGFISDLLLIAHVPDDIQDMMDRNILEEQKEEQRRNEATGGTF